MKPLYKKIAVIFLLGLICMTLIPAMPVAHAGSRPLDPGSVAGGISVQTYSGSDWFGIEDAIFGLLSAVQYGIGKMSQATASAVRWMIDFSMTVMDWPVVKSGFEVTLSFVNLLFVMAVIIIAFKMILQVGGHDDKKLLTHIILAALLVNFSMVIAGFLLDISNVLTNFFIKDIDGIALMGAFNPQRFNQAFGATGFAGFWVAIAQILFTIVIAGIILITISAVFIMATIRTVIVAGLLLLMPLTWGLWIFPSHDMQSHFSSWWKNFIKYGVTYLPTLTFFLWLAITTAGNVEFSPSTTAASAAMTGWGAKTISSLMQLVLVIGIIVFGLKASAEAGGIGADLGMSMAKGTGKRVASWSGRAALNARIPGLGGDKTLRGLGKSSAGLGSRLITNTWLKYIPGSMGLANKASESAHYEHNIEEFMKEKLSHMSYEQARDYNPTTDIGRAAKLKYLASLGKTSDFIGDPHGGGQARMEEMLQASMRMNHKVPGVHGNPNDAPLDIEEIKKAVEASPALAASMGIRSVTEQIGRMSSSKIADLHHSNFNMATPEGRELIAAVGNNAAAVKSLMTNGTDMAKEAFRVGIAALNTNTGMPIDPATGAAVVSPLQRINPALVGFSDDIRVADEEIKRLISNGAQSTSHPDHRLLNNEKGARQRAITNIETIVSGLAAGQRATVAGIISGEAVMRQVVARDTGNVINSNP